MRTLVGSVHGARTCLLFHWLTDYVRAPNRCRPSHPSIQINRFNICRSHVDAHGVLIVDDDIMLPPGLVDCMVHAWRQSPPRLVGPVSGARVVNNDGYYANNLRDGKRNPKGGCTSNLIIGKTGSYGRDKREIDKARSRRGARS